MANSSSKISQKAKPIITFANFGNYTVIFKTLFEELSLEVLPAEKTNPKAISEGAEIAPEMYCLPFKVSLGNYLSAIKRGANTIFMVTASEGSCRLRYYAVIQEKVLKEAGYNVNFVVFDQKISDVYSKIKKISNTSFFQILKAFYHFWRGLNLIEALERKAQYLRPREIEKGTTDQLLMESIFEIGDLKDGGGFSKLKREILERFSQVKIEEKEGLPKVGLIGEIYTVCDPNVNYGIERKLGEAGIEVHRQMSLSYHFTKKIFFKDFLIQRRINPYLGSTVGGHGHDAIYEMLDYVKKDFDGIIQLLPMACMPEVTVRPILEKIHQERQIPFLSLSLDEQVAEAGIDTRLEAFVDVVKSYHQNKKSLIRKYECRDNRNFSQSKRLFRH